MTVERNPAENPTSRRTWLKVGAVTTAARRGCTSSDVSHRAKQPVIKGPQ